MGTRLSHFEWNGIAGVPLLPSVHAAIATMSVRLQEAEGDGAELGKPEDAAAWIVAHAPETTIVVLEQKEVEALLTLAVASAQGLQAMAFERPT